MSANNKQVAGAHYKATIQHWDYVLANDIPYLEAQVIKYLTRWRKKNGYTDLLKAQHFLGKLLEVEAPPVPEPTQHDIAIDPSKPWPPRLYCSCHVGLKCPMHSKDVNYFHVGDGSEPGPGYVNQG